MLHSARPSSLVVWLLTSIGSLCMNGTATAHHSFGTFDMNRNIEIVGTIASVDFVNPHAWLHVETRGADGATAEYRCELRGATVLRRSGWAPEMFVVGEPVTVQGAPDREDPLMCYVNTLVLADGRTLDRYSQRPLALATGAAAGTQTAAMPRMPSGAPNLAGDWAVEQQVMSDPRGRLGALIPASAATRSEPGSIPQGSLAMPGSEGRSGPLSLMVAFYRLSVGAASPFVVPWLDKPIALTELGAAAALPPERHPQMNCQPTSIIADWYLDTLVNRITQSETTVTIEYGRADGLLIRTIYLNAAHPTNPAPTRAGHSVGRWENDVLVVDTVGFLPGMLAIQVPHGGDLHVVERFALNGDGTVLTRDYAAIDPDYFVGEYRGTDVTPRSPLPFVVDTCDAALNPFKGLPLQ